VLGLIPPKLALSFAGMSDSQNVSEMVYSQAMWMRKYERLTEENLHCMIAPSTAAPSLGFTVDEVFSS
jgi:hypothetical protein